MNLRLRDLSRFLRMHSGGCIPFHDAKGMANAGLMGAMVLMVIHGWSAGTAVSWLQLFSK